MYRTQLDNGAFMLHRCGMPSAAAMKSCQLRSKQKNTARQNVHRRNTSYGRLWAVVWKSSGIPNLPRGREGLGTSEFEKMHVLNPVHPSRSSRKTSAFMGRPMPRNRWKIT